MTDISEACALIRGAFGIDARLLSEDEFARAWNEAKCYLKIVHQVNFD
jgi:hypothetical protein